MSYDKTPGAIATARGCGPTRTYGGAYVELGLSPYGTPLEHFLIDPPNFMILQGGLDIPAVGMHLVEFGGAAHLFDHIGVQHYPNVSDWLEETLRYGVSRRIPTSLDFSKLNRESRLFVLHSKAYIDNVSDYAPYTCPTNKEHQHSVGDHCVGAVYNDLEVEGTALLDARTGEVERSMPSFRYRTMLGREQVPARRRPRTVTPRYTRAIFAKLPIGRIVVVGTPDDEEIARTAQKVRRAQVPVAFVDE